MTVLVLILALSCSETSNRVHMDELMNKDGKVVLKSNGQVYTGAVYDTFENGSIRMSGKYSAGIEDGNFEWKDTIGNTEKKSVYQDGELRQVEDKTNENIEELIVTNLGEDTIKYEQEFIESFMTLVQKDQFSKAQDLFMFYHPSLSVYESFGGPMNFYRNLYGKVKSFEIMDFTEQSNNGVLQIGARVEMQTTQYAYIVDVDFIELGKDSLMLHAYSVEPDHQEWYFVQQILPSLEGALNSGELVSVLNLLPEESRTINEEQGEVMSELLSVSKAFELDAFQLGAYEEGLFLELNLKAKIEDERLSGEYQYVNCYVVYAPRVSDLDGVLEFDLAGFDIKAISSQLDL